MIISCIHIQSFGKINNLTLELDGGINIITGENESGKSTICNFIKFVFYGLPLKTEEKQNTITKRTIPVCAEKIPATSFSACRRAYLRAPHIYASSAKAK